MKLPRPSRYPIFAEAEASLAAAIAALAKQEVAKAWSLVTDWRFWTDTRTRVAPMRAAGK